MSTKCISNTMVILMISDNSCHNMESSWISMTGLSRTYFIIDKIWQIQSRYVINTKLPGVFSIRPVFGLGVVFALGLRPRANTGHLSQIPGRILKTPGNIVYLLHTYTVMRPDNAFSALYNNTEQRANIRANTSICPDTEFLLAYCVSALSRFCDV